MSPALAGELPGRPLFLCLLSLLIRPLSTQSLHPKATRLLTVHSLPPGPTPSLPAVVPREPQRGHDRLGAGTPCLPLRLLPSGSSRWLSTAGSSRHRAPPCAPLSPSQPLTSCNGRAHSLLLPCQPQPWACGPFHPKTQCSPGGLLDVPGLGGQRCCSRRGHQVAAQGPGRLPKGACGWDCREPRSSRRW